jgi:multiple sugar transport system substrate-binding protein
MTHNAPRSMVVEQLNGGRMSRRNVLGGSLALGIGLPLVSAGAARAQDGGGISFWYATNPSETDFAVTVIDAWNASHDVQVDAQPVPAGNTTEEVVLAAIAAGTTPCVLANVAPAAVPQYGAALLDLSAAFADGESFLVERSGEAVVDQYRSAEGGLHQVPWKVNPVMIFYNRAMFEQAGVDPAMPPRTYTEMLEAMGQLKAAGSTPIQPSIDQTWWQRWFAWYPFYRAAGNQLLLNPEATAATFNNDAARAAMTFWREVYANEYAPLATAEQDPYSQGQVAMRIAGPWAMPDIERGGVLADTGVMPIPLPDGAAAPEGGMSTTFADSKNIGNFANCADPESAWEFVKFYVSPENDVAFFETTQQIPLRQEIDQAIGADFFTEYPLLESFAQQAQHTLNVDMTARSVDIFGAISLAYQAAAIYAEQSVDEALAEAEAQVNSLLGGG